LRFGTAFLVFKSEIWVENYFLENGFRDFQGVLLFFSFLFFSLFYLSNFTSIYCLVAEKAKGKKNRVFWGLKIED
jgi:hypothetical protein